MRVLFVCSGGMSSAIVVNALKSEAEKNSVHLTVKAIGSSEVAFELESPWDVVMVAPQIRHRFDKIKKEADEKNVPCGAIPPQAYTPLGGPVLFETLQKLVN